MSILQRLTWGGRLVPSFPINWYYADISCYAKTVSVAADRYTLVTPNHVQVAVGSTGTSLEQFSSQSIDLSVATNWDDYYDDSDWDSTNYTTAANRKGLDFYLYVVASASGTIPKFLLSASASAPIGYTTSNSRLIGGFHCFCADMSTPSAWATSQSYTVGKTVIPSTGDVGYWYRCVAAHTSGTEPTWTTTVGNTNYYTGTTVGWVCEARHSLSGYVTGDILPMSVWDLKHKSAASYGNIGQVYNPEWNQWVGIYLTSGTLLVPTIVYAGTVLKNSDSNSMYVNWNNAVQAGKVLGMRLPSDAGFQSLAGGSNQQTVINGGAPSPFTAIEYSDTLGRRMVSNIGCESCCGLVNQWLDEQSFRYSDPPSHTHTISNVSGDPDVTYVSNAASVDLLPPFGYSTAVTGSRGQIYGQGATYRGDVKMRAGGCYDVAVTPLVDCGSRSRLLDQKRWHYAATLGFRLVADNIEK